MGRLKNVLSVMMAMAFSVAVEAASFDELKSFYRDVTTLAGDFEQRLIDEDGDTLERYAGRFWIARPGQFIWLYDTPYEQQMGSDGAALWHYDVDLRQLTIRDAHASLSGTPARLLGGELDQLDEFDVVELGDQNDLQWLGLKPRGEEADFEEIRIGLRAGEPVVIELADRLGQRTRMQLHDLRRNPELSADRFAIPQPEGVTIVDERAPD